MTTFDQYGATDVRIIKDLELRIAALEAQVRERHGAPVTKASGPFLLPDGGTPAAPPSGVYLYVDGGSLRWMGPSSEGGVGGLDVPAVTWSLFNPPASYSQAHIQTIIDTLDSLQTSYTALLAELT